MKKCTIGWFSKIVTFLVFAVLFVPLTGIAFYFAFIYPQTHHEERLIFLAGLIMCVDLLGYAIYRMFYLGLVWTEYDMEKVVFHYSRKEEYRFRWEEIPGSQVQAQRMGGGYIFYIQGKKKQRKIPLNWLSRGYKDFEKTLELTGVLYRIGAKTQEEFKRDAEKVCKTCGGSGYMPVYVSDYIEIPSGSIIKESRTENPDYCGKQYIVYISPGDSRKRIRVNTYYLLQGEKVRLCTHYDRGLCDTLEEYDRLPIEYIEEQAYGSWMDGAR